MGGLVLPSGMTNNHDNEYRSGCTRSRIRIKTPVGKKFGLSDYLTPSPRCPPFFPLAFVGRLFFGREFLVPENYHTLTS